MATGLTDRTSLTGKTRARKFESSVASYQLEDRANGELVLTPVFHPRTHEGAGFTLGIFYLLLCLLANFTVAMPIYEMLGKVGVALFFSSPVIVFIIGLKTGKPVRKRMQARRSRITMDAEGFTIRKRSYRWADVAHFYAKAPGPRYVEAASETGLNLRLQREDYLNEVRWMVFMQFGNEPAVPLVSQLTKPQAQDIVELLENKKAEYLAKS